MKTKKVEVLQETYKTPDSNFDGLFSKTSQFIIPATGLITTKPIVYKFFKNAYLNDVNHLHNYETPVFILFSVKDFKDKDWVRLYNILIKSENYITDYDVGIQNNEFLVMVVFKVYDKFKEDYYKFKQGKYSLFSKEYKKEFPEFLDSSSKNKNIHWRIINKDPELAREIEENFGLNHGELDNSTDIWEKPRKEREYYRYAAK